MRRRRRALRGAGRVGRLTLARIVIALAVTLAGCSAEPTVPVANSANEAAAPSPEAVNAPAEAPLAPIAKDPSAGPAGADDYTWSLLRSGGGAGFPYLLYGTRGSDELVVNFQCREPGKVTVLQVRADSDPDGKEAIRLRSGGRELTLAVTAGKASGDGNVPVTANLPSGDPLLAAFRASGWLQVSSGGRTIAADAIDAAEKATVQQFFVACGG